MKVYQSLRRAMQDGYMLVGYDSEVELFVVERVSVRKDGRREKGLVFSQAAV